MSYCILQLYLQYFFPRTFDSEFPCYSKKITAVWWSWLWEGDNRKFPLKIPFSFYYNTNCVQTVKSEISLLLMFKHIFKAESVWTRKLVQTHLQVAELYTALGAMNKASRYSQVRDYLVATLQQPFSLSLTQFCGVLSHQRYCLPRCKTWILKAVKGLRGFVTRIK